MNSNSLLLLPVDVVVVDGVVVEVVDEEENLLYSRELCIKLNLHLLVHIGSTISPR